MSEAFRTSDEHKILAILTGSLGAVSRTLSSAPVGLLYSYLELYFYQSLETSHLIGTPLQLLLTFFIPSDMSASNIDNHSKSKQRSIPQTFVENPGDSPRRTCDRLLHHRVEPDGQLRYLMLWAPQRHQQP